MNNHREKRFKGCFCEDQGSEPLRGCKGLLFAEMIGVVTKSSDDVRESIRLQIETESASLVHPNFYSPFLFDLGTASKAFCVCPVVTGAATPTKLLAFPEGGTPGWELGAGGPPVEELGVGPPAVAGSGAETGAWKVICVHFR